ncbi:MAG: NUDIX hydrolase [Candidatus Omnitrophica bacterium]|nr:NUDIX hydrolase [Candidatus Omnitrophota bacterium]
MECPFMKPSLPGQDRTITSGKFLRLVIRDGWEYVERVNCSGAVIIVARTDDDKIILVEQFRRPVGKFTIGFPAGLVGDDRGQRGENIIKAARREMIEETGYRPSRIQKLFVGPVSAGMCRDMVAIVHASGLKKVGAGGGLDDHENIQVHEVPRQGIDAWIKKQVRKGRLVGPNIFAGLYFLEHWVK